MFLSSGPPTGAQSFVLHPPWWLSCSNDTETPVDEQWSSLDLHSIRRGHVNGRTDPRLAVKGCLREQNLLACHGRRFNSPVRDKGWKVPPLAKYQVGARCLWGWLLASLERRAHAQSRYKGDFAQGRGAVKMVGIGYI
jgi:hypothetical protein